MELIAVRDKETGEFIGLRERVLERNEPVIQALSSTSLTAIIVRFLCWVCLNVLKSVYVIIFDSVLHSAGIVAVIGHYFYKMGKSIVRVWTS